MQKVDKKVENVAIQADQLKDRGENEVSGKIVVKMNELGLNRKGVRREEGKSVEDVWLKFKDGVIGAVVPVEVCGVRQSKGSRKRTRRWNDKIKEVVKQKKVAYLRWLQQKTVEAKEVYQKAKTNAWRVLRQAQNEEWAELGKFLQEDFQKNQRKF